MKYGINTTPPKVGFTLVELLVVIIIMIILIGITIPVINQIKVKNQLIACEFNLRNIAQALKMYKLQEGAYPPFEPIEKPVRDRAGNPRIILEQFGLWHLYESKYIRSAKTLHCPADAARTVKPRGEWFDTNDDGVLDWFCPYPSVDTDKDGKPDYLCSYQLKDDKGTLDDTTDDEWSYQPSRIIEVDTDNNIDNGYEEYEVLLANRSYPAPKNNYYNALYRRQLEGRFKYIDPDTGKKKIKSKKPWLADDSTVVLWCPFHRKLVFLPQLGRPELDTRAKSDDLILFIDGRGERQPTQRTISEMPPEIPPGEIDNEKKEHWRRKPLEGE